jgi:hypothetical protein
LKQPPIEDNIKDIPKEEVLMIQPLPAVTLSPFESDGI